MQLPLQYPADEKYDKRKISFSAIPDWNTARAKATTLAIRAGLLLCKIDFYRISFESTERTFESTDLPFGI